MDTVGSLPSLLNLGRLAAGAAAALPSAAARVLPLVLASAAGGPAVPLVLGVGSLPASSSSSSCNGQGCWEGACDQLAPA